MGVETRGQREGEKRRRGNVKSMGGILGLLVSPSPCPLVSLCPLPVLLLLKDYGVFRLLAVPRRLRDRLGDCFAVGREGDLAFEESVFRGTFDHKRVAFEAQRQTIAAIISVTLVLGFMVPPGRMLVERLILKSRRG
jgi:hypothetical protein